MSVIPLSGMSLSLFCDKAQKRGKKWVNVLSMFHSFSCVVLEDVFSSNETFWEELKFFMGLMMAAAN